MMRLLFLSLCFIFILNDVSISTDPYFLYEEARKLLRQKKNDYAFIKLKQLIRDFPQYKYADFAQIEIAKYYFLNKDYLNAKSELNKLLSNYPESKYADEANLYLKKINDIYLDYKKDLKLKEYLENAEALAGSRDWNNLLKECDKIGKLPNLRQKEILKLRFHCLLCADNFKKLKDNESEKEVLLIIIRLNPKDSEISNRLNSIDKESLNGFLKIRDYAAAKALLEESKIYNPKAASELDRIAVLEQNVSNSLRYLESANNYLAKEDYENALKEYKRAVTSDEYTAQKKGINFLKSEIIRKSFDTDFFAKMEDCVTRADYDNYQIKFRVLIEENNRLIRITRMLKGISEFEKIKLGYEKLISENYGEINKSIVKLENDEQWDLVFSLWDLIAENTKVAYFENPNDRELRELSLAEARLLVLNKYPDGKVMDTKRIAFLKDPSVMEKEMLDAMIGLRKKGNLLFEEAKNFLSKKDTINYQAFVDKGKLFIKEAEMLESILLKE